jgi:multidrug resistance protein
MSLKDQHPHLGEIIEATEVVSGAISERRMKAIVWMLAGSVALQMTGFGIIMPIFAKRLEEFGSGVEALGLMTMSFALAQLVAGPIIGSLADRIGRKPVILFSLFAFIATNLGFLFAPNTGVFLVVRALEGGLTAGLLPSALGVVADIVPTDRRAQWVGIVMGALGAGFIFGPVVGGVLFEWMGYEAPFIASAIMGFLALVAAASLVPESRTRAVRLREKLRLLREAESEGSTNKAVSAQNSLWASLPRPFKVFGTLLLIDFLLSFTFGFVEPQMVFYFYNDLGWTPIQFGIIAGAFGLALVIGQTTLGRLSDSIERRPVITAGILLFAMFFFGLWFTDNFALMLLVAVIAGLGEALIMPAASAFYLDITSEQHRSRVMGIKESAVSLGGVLGPLMVVVAASFMSPKAMFATAGFVSLIGAVAAVAFLATPKKDSLIAVGVSEGLSHQRSLAAQSALRRVVVAARTVRSHRISP